MKVFHKGKKSGKWLQTRKMNKNTFFLYTTSGGCFYFSGNSRKFTEKCYSSWDHSIMLFLAVSWIFWKFQKETTPQSYKKNLIEKKKISFDLWFSLPNMKVTLKQRRLTLEGLTPVNVSIIKLYDFFLFKYLLK